MTKVWSVRIFYSFTHISYNKFTGFRKQTCIFAYELRTIDISVQMHMAMRKSLFLLLFAVSLSLHAKGATAVNDSVDITELSKLRQQIDSLDNELIHTLSERMKVCLAVGEFKKKHHVAVVQSNRFNELLARLCQLGKENGLTEDFVKEIMETIHKESVRQQKAFIEKSE